MITGIEGTIVSIGPDWVDISVGGVTIRANIPESATALIGSTGDIAKLFTSLQVREDSLTLYGFPIEETRSAFEALISINGVGPRLALGILSTLTTNKLSIAITAGNPDAFKGVSGGGTKTANRIVLELKGKLDWQTVSTPQLDTNTDLMDALTALGYSTKEAATAITDLPDNAPSSLEERVRITLQNMTG